MIAEPTRQKLKEELLRAAKDGREPRLLGDRDGDRDMDHRVGEEDRIGGDADGQELGSIFFVDSGIEIEHLR